MALSLKECLLSTLMHVATHKISLRILREDLNAELLLFGLEIMKLICTIMPLKYSCGPQPVLFSLKCPGMPLQIKNKILQLFRCSECSSDVAIFSLHVHTLMSFDQAL